MLGSLVSLTLHTLIMEERDMPCCVRGYHVYQAIWTAGIGEELLCEREPTNAVDRYAVAVVKIAL